MTTNIAIDNTNIPTACITGSPVVKFCSCEITICQHYNDIIMSAIASQITSPTIVYSAVDSDTDERKHESSASLAFVGEFTGAHMRGTYYICTIWFILITQQTNSMVLFRLFCCSYCDIQIVIYWLVSEPLFMTTTGLTPPDLVEQIICLLPFP